MELSSFIFFSIHHRSTKVIFSVRVSSGYMVANSTGRDPGCHNYSSGTCYMQDETKRLLTKMSDFKNLNFSYCQSLEPLSTDKGNFVDDAKTIYIKFPLNGCLPT